jgi:bifunctional UDP-N-acetylglucosamine pyrophosphorylase/glucosamine-1-phosphate N-acetyltransferase
MTSKKTAVLVLAAGLGTRMKSATPKVMHPVAGRPMIQHLIATVETLAPERVIVVVAADMAQVADAVRPRPTVVQKKRLGTADAVLAARDRLKGFRGDVLVLYGDTPLITAPTLRRLLAARRGKKDPAVAVLGIRPKDPSGYGRLILGANGTLEAIVEDKDATPEQRAVGLCNAGAMAIDGRVLLPFVARIGNQNAKGEFYLTDIVAVAKAQRRASVVVEADADELIGINSRADLAAAERIVQERLRAQAMAGGATLIDPATVWFSFDTRLGRDVTIGPNVAFGPGVVVGDDVAIRGFCHIEGATIADGAVVGPFARLRPGTRVGEGVHIGNFVEVKNAVLEAGAKANHLAYVGDARVGAGANVGAGTITCNYDGFAKRVHRLERRAGRPGQDRRPRRSRRRQRDHQGRRRRRPRRDASAAKGDQGLGQTPA